MSRILPFTCYMGFIAANYFFENDAGGVPLWMYPVKITFVTALLIYYWSEYTELKEKVFLNRQEVVLTVGVGVLVYLAWVRIDFSWARQGEVGEGYNPFKVSNELGFLYAGLRLTGAALIVPVMEELFWRSFILRYTISPDFLSVKLGKFTLMSCLVTVVLFGIEHNLWLAGMMAGLAYNLLLYKTKRLWPCIVAHGVTNLILGGHVLISGEWYWW